MKRFLLALAVIGCLGFAYISYDAYNDQDEYVEACLYFSETRASKSNCYDVYPADHKKQWLIKGAASVVGAGFFSMLFLVEGFAEPQVRHTPSRDEYDDDDYMNT